MSANNKTADPQPVTEPEHEPSQPVYTVPSDLDEEADEQSGHGETPKRKIDIESDIDSEAEWDDGDDDDDDDDGDEVPKGKGRQKLPAVADPTSLTSIKDAYRSAPKRKATKPKTNAPKRAKTNTTKRADQTTHMDKIATFVLANLPLKRDLRNKFVCALLGHPPLGYKEDMFKLSVEVGKTLDKCVKENKIDQDMAVSISKAIFQAAPTK